jgi:DNA-binding MarR family transcriptional regulator
MSSTTSTSPLLLPKLLDEVKEAVLDGLHDRLAEAGYPDIREAHGCVFRYLHEGGVRLSDLALMAKMTKQAIGEHIAELEKLGYLEREPDPLDGRAKIIKPTAKGSAGMSVAQAYFEEIEAKWAATFGPDRIAEMRETLELILATYH